MNNMHTSQHFITAGELSHPVIMEVILKRAQLRPSYQRTMEVGLQEQSGMGGMN